MQRKSGHAAAECPEPRSAEGVDCKRCGESTNQIIDSSRTLTDIGCSGSFREGLP